MAAAQLSAIDADSGVAAADDVDCARGVEGGGDDSGEEASNLSLAKALHDDVMADVEAVLKKKEDLLWSRGRVELQSLREDRARVASTLGDIQVRQDQLVSEHSQMRGTLMDITVRLEHLAREMRDSLRVGPPQAVSSASGPAMDVFGSLDGGGLDGGLLLHGGYDVVDAGALAQFAAADAAMLDGPRTPTRAALGASSASAAGAHGSPAVRLSLASALDASVTATPPSQQSAKRLAIAECLDLDGPSDSSRRRAGGREDFTADSPPSLHAGLSSWQAELSPALDQAAGSQLRSLRAEAPAFVPGAGFAAADPPGTSGDDAVPAAASMADVPAAPAGLRLERPPAQVENEEAFRDPSSP